MKVENIIKKGVKIVLACLIVLMSLCSSLQPSSVHNKAKAANTSAGNIHVTPDNFLDYFTLNGTATYEQSTGIVTLTENKLVQSGNFALNNKIDMSKNFTLTGKINLGDKSNTQNGADGIGFAFHSGDTTDIDSDGGAQGIGGLTGGFGWKADSHYNYEPGRNYVKGPDRFANPISPDTSTPSFAGFVY